MPLPPRVLGAHGLLQSFQFIVRRWAHFLRWISWRLGKSIMEGQRVLPLTSPRAIFVSAVARRPVWLHPPSLSPSFATPYGMPSFTDVDTSGRSGDDFSSTAFSHGRGCGFVVITSPSCTLTNRAGWTSTARAFAAVESDRLDGNVSGSRTPGAQLSEGRAALEHSPDGCGCPAYTRFQLGAFPLRCSSAFLLSDQCRWALILA